MIMLAPSDRNPASSPSPAIPASKSGDSPCTVSCNGHGGRLRECTAGEHCSKILSLVSIPVNTQLAPTGAELLPLTRPLG